VKGRPRTLRRKPLRSQGVVSLHSKPSVLLW